ncbi:TlpA family protein disulfide reductase [Jejudonia soesokkakensis]|uniref:TlpA family protein disulfide reductase n=1 Tax=Jejudonia soesokkakensis TaxID=1323432 RepID=A0ABW2MVL9_9FLAO
MKYIFLSVIVLLISCAESKKEEPAAFDSALVGETANMPEETAQLAIPSYNFEEFEKFLQKKNDTTYVVNFWATWCKPCIKELPYFEKINADYADDKVKVILVSLDFPDVLEKQVIPFVENRGLKSQVILLDDGDANSWIPKVDKNWSGAIPATVIYNKNRRKFYEKEFTYEELETEVKSIL